MTAARAVVALVSTITVAASLFACTLTRSLDYLTSGEPDGGGSGRDGGDALGDSGAGVAAPLAPAQFSPRNLAQDAESLYWTNGDGAIVTVPKTGGATRTIATIAPPATVTWLSADSAAGGDLFLIVDDAVKRVPKAGGEVVLVERDLPKPAALAVDTDAIFVIHGDLDAVEPGFLARYARDGSTRTTLSPEDHEPRALALHGTSVFWAADGLETSGVFELPKDAAGDAGAPMRIYDDDDLFIDTAEAFGVDEQAIYFFDFETLKRLDRGSSEPQTRLTTLFEPPGGTVPTAFAHDTTNLYVVDRRDRGAIIRVPKTGGPPSAIASNQEVPTAVVADATAIYFTVQGTGLAPDGAVVRVVK